MSSNHARKALQLRMDEATVITPELTTRNTAMEAGRDSEWLWRDIPRGVEDREWRIEDWGSSAVLRQYSSGRNDSRFDLV